MKPVHRDDERAQVLLPRDRHKLPSGWQWSRVNEVGRVQLGRQRAPEHHQGEQMRPYLRVANVFEDRIDTSDVMQMNFKDAEFERFRLRPGDVLLNEGQSKHLVGRPAIYNGEVPGACFQNTLVRFQSRVGILPAWALAVFRTYLYDGTFLSIARWTTNIAHLGADRFAQLDFPVAPAPEQRRISEALDSCLTRLKAASGGLKRVEANLKRYRASVLMAAVEGRLVPTEAELARKEKRDYEPASALLSRILKERRRRWEQAEVVKLKAKRDLSAGDKWKERYEEPAAIDSTGLPDLPEGWCWASVDQLDSGDRKCSYGVLVPGPDVEDGVPLIRIGDIQDGRIEASGLKRISKSIADAFGKTYLRGGEVLISLVGTIGRTAVVPETLAGANVARAIGVLPVTALVMPHWVEMWFRSPTVRALTIGKAHEVARKTLNLEDVRAAPVALPPVDEQRRIQAAVDAAESVATKVETTLALQTTRMSRMRQGVLKWAFQGKLVDQDPMDEPASVLLDRIRRERSAASTGEQSPPRVPVRKTA